VSAPSPIAARRATGKSHAGCRFEKGARDPKHYVFLFEDECEFHLNPSLSRMWWLVGKQPVVPSAGQDRRIAVFGSFNPQLGRLHIHLPGRKNAASFVAHLKGLCQIYPNQHLLIFLDNCSIHHAKMVQRFLADHCDRMTLIWNAPYTPELNLIERYWGHLKAKATNNYFFGTVEKLESAIRRAVRDFNRSPALRMTCNLQFMRPLRKAA
jgi:transposase